MLEDAFAVFVSERLRENHKVFPFFGAEPNLITHYLLEKSAVRLLSYLWESKQFASPLERYVLAGGFLLYLGDALGTDCTVFDSLRGGQDPAGWFAKAYRTDGKTNEDWYGWQQPVLAPFDGTVLEVHLNPVTNAPGDPNPKPASRIVFVRTDGTHVMYGHVNDVRVRKGERVRAGQPVARVGNNGYARAPHIHIGAWRGKTPLQIRFDLRSR